jgi:hydrogenase maturation protease
MTANRKTEGSPRVVVIGVGNEYRGDDGVGRRVARELREGAPGTMSILEASGEGTALLEAWKGADSVIIIDAAASGAPPGTIHRLDAQAQGLPVGFSHSSTHSFGVAQAIELARVLDRLPRRLVVYGIEGKTFEPDTGLSSEVARAAQEMVGRLLREIEAAGHPSWSRGH